MAEEVSPSPLPRPQPESQPRSRSNQSQPRNQPTSNPNHPQADPVFPTMDLFRATIARLEKAKKAGTWVPPMMGAGLAYDLTPAPEFISMGIFIDLNQPQPGEKPQPPKNKEHASTILPVLCMKLAKATELFYHTMPDHEMRDCLPKYAKTWGYLYRFFSRKIHEHVSAVSRATLDRGFQLTCTIVAGAMQNGGFYEMMNQSNEVQRALVINGLFKPRHMWYLFRDQFKAVSFPFIFHNGEKTPISRIRAGKAIIKANYLDVPYHGHARGIVKSLRRLSASPDFKDMVRRQSGGGDKGGGKKGTRAKKRKEKEDGHGIAKRSK
ncbi:hypothetical protein VE01_04416 [Pseudogymnoascus verrucosus]|uniref:Uncharacterized protein n=1 Tax=Pseudogymnoascus verrucosus TaxID=342668 RepID=A0A1B8GNL7_9PEZI|nr:uncharacterized protein VE01_04416 [Pseudogymnoascus verrucosus]OBT97443.1 hypothetical protein VE01_04416 [Pseudogymnoascus verrucosus]